MDTIQKNINTIQEKISTLESLKDYKHNYYQLQNKDSRNQTYVIIKHIYKMKDDIIVVDAIYLCYHHNYRQYSVSFENVYESIDINNLHKISKEQFQDIVNEFKNNLDKIMK